MPVFPNKGPADQDRAIANLRWPMALRDAAIDGRPGRLGLTLGRHGKGAIAQRGKTSGQGRGRFAARRNINGGGIPSCGVRRRGFADGMAPVGVGRKTRGARERSRRARWRTRGASQRARGGRERTCGARRTSCGTWRGRKVRCRALHSGRGEGIILNQKNSISLPKVPRTVLRYLLQDAIMQAKM